MFTVQVNPHTHQLKLCDFGSAKMLVSFMPLPLVIDDWVLLFALSLSLLHFIRWKENPMFLTSVQDIIVLQSSYLVPLSTQLRLIYGLLVVWWLSYFLDRWINTWNYTDLALFLSSCALSLTLLFQLIFQPLFPGESGVDQLVEIIKVRLLYYFSSVFVNILFTIHILGFGFWPWHQRNWIS